MSYEPFVEEGELASPKTAATGTIPDPTPQHLVERRAARSRRWKLVWRWTKRVALGCFVMLAIGVIALAIIVRRIEAGLPSVAELRNGYRPPQVTRVYAADGTVIAELFTERRTVIKIAELPPQVKLAILAAEDASFYEHDGVNYLGIARALWVNFRHGKTKQGASTITQQVVKNLLLDSSRTVMRKLREALLARRLEQELSKDEILELYLNHIYFGSGRYGIEEAARGYFGKHASELTLAESALIAGLPAAPNAYSPRNDMKASLARRAHVLAQMKEKKFCTPTEYDAAMVEPVKLAPIVEASGDIAPEVVDLVRKTIRDAVGEEAARRGGFIVETSIDPRLQAAARAAARFATSEYDKRWKLTGPFPAYPADGKDPKTKKKLPPQTPAFEGLPVAGHGDVYVGVVVGHDDALNTIFVDVGSVHGAVKLDDHDRYDPTNLAPSAWAAIGTRLRVSLLAPPPADPANTNQAKAPLRLELGPEAAMVAIDVRTRHVLALIGNVEAQLGGLDRAIASKRQPGSTFKPFVYGAAISSKKYTAASLVDANVASFGGYDPKNFEAFTSKDPVRLREALAASINLVSVRVTKDLGPQPVIDFARALGITTPLQPDLAIALGSYEVKPIELAAAYATFADGGMYEEPIIITRIIGPDGKDVPLPHKDPVRAMGEAEAYVLTSMMASVVDHGTAIQAKVLQRPLAGKTGTSNEAKDTWFAGFDPEIAAAIWVGYDDGKPLGNSEFGAKTALPGWIAFMKEATNGKPAVEFPRPPGVVTVKIDPKTGKLPYMGQDDAIEEIFVQGTDPTEIAPTPDPDTDDGGGPTIVAMPKNDSIGDPWAKP